MASANASHAAGSSGTSALPDMYTFTGLGDLSIASLTRIYWLSEETELDYPKELPPFFRTLIDYFVMRKRSEGASDYGTEIQRIDHALDEQLANAVRGSAADEPTAAPPIVEVSPASPDGAGTEKDDEEQEHGYNSPFYAPYEEEVEILYDEPMEEQPEHSSRHEREATPYVPADSPSYAPYDPSSPLVSPSESPDPTPQPPGADQKPLSLQALKAEEPQHHLMQVSPSSDVICLSDDDDEREAEPTMNGAVDSVGAALARTCALDDDIVYERETLLDAHARSSLKRRREARTPSPARSENSPSSVSSPPAVLLPPPPKPPSLTLLRTQQAQLQREDPQQKVIADQKREVERLRYKLGALKQDEEEGKASRESVEEAEYDLQLAEMQLADAKKQQEREMESEREQEEEQESPLGPFTYPPPPIPLMSYQPSDPISYSSYSPASPCMSPSYSPSSPVDPYAQQPYSPSYSPRSPAPFDPYANQPYSPSYSPSSPAAFDPSRPPPFSPSYAPSSPAYCAPHMSPRPCTPTYSPMSPAFHPTPLFAPMILHPIAPPVNAFGSPAFAQFPRPDLGPCEFCFASDHRPEFCNKYGSHEERQKRIEQLNLCLHCLGAHLAMDCPHKYTSCPKCGRHNTHLALCRKIRL